MLIYHINLQKNVVFTVTKADVAASFAPCDATSDLLIKSYNCTASFNLLFKNRHVSSCCSDLSCIKYNSLVL